MKEKSQANVVLITFLKTSCIILMGVCFALVCVTSLIPRQIFGLYNDLNLNLPTVKGYEKLYQDTGSFEDLYNLVCVCGKFEDYEKLEKYSVEFLNKSSVEKTNFVEKMDASTKTASTPENYAYVASVENFLLNQAVLACCKNEKLDKATELSLLGLNGKFEDNPLVFGLETLLSCVDESKQNSLCVQLFNQNYAGNSFEFLVAEKLDCINFEMQKLGDVNTSLAKRLDKLALLSAKLCVLRLDKCVLEHNEISVSEVVQNISQTKNEYNNVLRLFEI